MRFGVWSFHSRKSANGFGLIEIVVVVAVVTAVFFAFLQAEILSVKLLRNEKEILEATMLAQESLEAVRSVRDEAWTSIASTTNGTKYYPVVESSKWKFSASSPGLINGKYTRYVVFGQVLRNAQDQISSSGTVDGKTRKVTSMATTTNRQVELTAYITNFQDSLARPKEAKVISFEDSTTDSNLASFPSNNAGDGDPAQGFTTLASAIKATKIELFLKRATTTPSNIYAELRAAPTSTPLGVSNTITSSTISNSALTWVEFRFPDSISLKALTKYYIRLRSSPSSNDSGSGSVGPIHWGYKQTPSSPYSGGEARHHIGQFSNPDYTGVAEADKDFGFRIYALQ